MSPVLRTGIITTYLKMRRILRLLRMGRLIIGFSTQPSGRAHWLRFLPVSVHTSSLET